MHRRESVKSGRAPQRCPCPTCKQPVPPPQEADPGKSKSFPFCCERCKLIDLGAWLDAEYGLAVGPDEEFDDLPLDDTPDILS